MPKDTKKRNFALTDKVWHDNIGIQKKRKCGSQDVTRICINIMHSVASFLRRYTSLESFQCNHNIWVMFKSIFPTGI